MELYDPDGVRLDSGVFSLSRKAAASGNYTVILGAAAPRTAGGYSFAWQLLNQPAGATPLACGGSTTGALSAGESVPLLHARRRRRRHAAAALHPHQREFLAADGSLRSRGRAHRRQFRRHPKGRRRRQLSGGDRPRHSLTETGAYNVAFQRPNNPCSPVSLTCGQTTLRQVNLPGQLDTFTFNATGGDQTTIRLTSRSGAYSPFVEMYNSGRRAPHHQFQRPAAHARCPPTASILCWCAIAARSIWAAIASACRTTPTPARSTTPKRPMIILVRPTGGEVLPGGTTFRIQWQSDDNVGVAAHADRAVHRWRQDFRRPVGQSRRQLAAYDWIVPADIAPSRTAVLRVTASDAAGNAQSAIQRLADR